MAKVPALNIPSTFKAQFTEAIQNVLLMAAPENLSDRATFVWDEIRTFSGPVDHSGNPYDINEAPIITKHPDVQINVGVEFTDKAPVGTALGQMDTPRVILTMLDVDYNLVQCGKPGGARHVFLGGNQYNVDFVAPPIGLEQVTIYQVYVHAQDET